MNKIHIILGPTSSGKTTLALEICKKMGGEIISADSRQVYKLLDVGTGKVPVNNKVNIERKQNHWILDGINIWGYDLAEPDDFYSAFNYAEFATSKIKELKEQNKNIYVVGGTGFYIALMTGEVKPSYVPPNPELRKELASLTLIELQEKLKGLNTKEYEKIDQKNPARLIRAIEKNIYSDANEHKEKLSIQKLETLTNVEYKYYGLTAPREHLYQKADTWLESVWQNGFLEETASLLDSKYKDSPKLQGIVYKSAVSFLKKELNETDAIQKAKFELHAYIRRQETYFKKMPNVTWMDITQDNYSEKLYNSING